MNSESATLDKTGNFPFIIDHYDCSKLRRNTWIWRKNIIPYKISKNISDDASDVYNNIKEAIRLFSSTCIRFIEAGQNYRKEHIIFELGDESISYFGRKLTSNEDQTISISKNHSSVRKIASLLMNVLGFCSKSCKLLNGVDDQSLYINVDEDSVLNPGENSPKTLSSGDINAVQYLYGNLRCSRDIFGDHNIKQHLFQLKYDNRTLNVCIYCLMKHRDRNCFSTISNIYSDGEVRNIACECDCNKKVNKIESNLEEYIQKQAKSRKFTLKIKDWNFERVQYHESKNTEIVYEVQKKTTQQSYDLKIDPNEKAQHSQVIKLKKLRNSEDAAKRLMKQFEIRKSINCNECPYIIPFYDEGFVYWQKELYYAVRYDNPGRDYDHWISYDHKGISVEILDLYRLAKTCLESFKYLNENKLFMNDFSKRYIFVGNFAEDRQYYFRILFKGITQAPGGEFELVADEFSPPEADTTDLYKSHSFRLGMFICYTVLRTNVDENNYDDYKFPKDYNKNSNKISSLIDLVISYLEKTVVNIRDFKIKEFLQALLNEKIEERPSVEQLLKYDFMIIGEALDKQQFLEEQKEEENILKKQKEEDDKIQAELAYMNIK